MNTLHRPPVLIIGLGLAAMALGQEPNWQWARSAGGEQDDEARAVATDAEGNVFVAGSFASTNITLGDTILVNFSANGQKDLFLVKYDPAGNVLWVRQGAGPYSQAGVSVATDASGSVFVAGDFLGSITLGTYQLTNTPGAGFFLAKYAADGTLLWATTAENGLNSGSTHIASDGMGGVYMIGYFDGPFINLGGQMLENPNPTNVDVFLVRYDGAGNALWARSAGSELSDIGKGVAVDAEGNAVVTGYFHGAALHIGTAVLSNPGPIASDIFLAKYGPDGTFLWALNAGGPDPETASSIAVDGSGDILLCGMFSGATFAVGGEVLENHTDQPHTFDVFVAKYHGNGAPVWARSGGGDLTEFANAVIIDADDNVFLAGYGVSDTLTFGPMTYTAGLEGDFMVVKYSPTGEVLGVVHAGGDDLDKLNDAVFDPSGNLLLAGALRSSVIDLGANELTNAGMQDIMLLKLDGVPSGSAEAAPPDDLNLYPVPSTGPVTITSMAPMERLLVRDATGRAVYRSSPKANSAQLELHVPGVYLTEIMSKGRTTSKRLVICE